VSRIIPRDVPTLDLVHRRCCRVAEELLRQVRVLILIYRLSVQTVGLLARGPLESNEIAPRRPNSYQVNLSLVLVCSTILGKRDLRKVPNRRRDIRGWCVSSAPSAEACGQR
jgi:hypothetical protein